MTLQKGEMVHNRYRILHRMGDTNYRAMDMSLRQACVVKEFTGTTSERITQLASVQHARLPRIIDLVSDGDQSLLVMDLIEGANLPERMFETDDPTPDEQIWAWVEQLVETLTYLHGQTPPVTHGNISLDTVTIRPNGEAALTDFATHEREPAVDVRALGHIIGYLVTDTHPPQTDEQLLAKLAPLPGRLPQLAQELLNGVITKAEDVLTNKNVLPESPATTFLPGALGSPADVQADTASQENEPVMPWDRSVEDKSQPVGPGTIVWGERAGDTENVSNVNPPPAEPVIKSTEAIPDPLPTQMVGSPPTQVSPMREVPTSQPIRESSAPRASQPVAPPPVAQAAPPKEAEKSKGFNWLWIVVGIMAGIILLCLGAVGFVALNWDEIMAEPTSEALFESVPAPDNDEQDGAAPVAEIIENTPEPIPTLAPTEEPVNEPAEGVNLPEEEPTAEGVNAPAEEAPTEAPTEVPTEVPAEEQVNAPVEENLEANLDADDPAPESAGGVSGTLQGDVYRNDERGYLFVVPEDFVVLSDENGAVTMGRNVAGADESILLRVFPLAANSSAELLMGQIEAEVPDTEGLMYGRQPAEFDELSGLYQLSSIYPTDANPYTLISEIYTLQNDEAAVLIIGTMTAEAEISAVIFDILPDFLTDLEIYVGSAYTSE